MSPCDAFDKGDFMRENAVTGWFLLNAAIGTLEYSYLIAIEEPDFAGRY